MTTVAWIPADAALPQLGSLLDPELMAGVIGRTLGPDQPQPPLRIGYLRYRPGKSLLVTYAVDVAGTEHSVFALADAREDLAARANEPAAAALAAKVAGRVPARTPLAHSPEVDALIEWLPLDLALPAMAEQPERLRERLVAEGVDVQPGELPRPVKHKPTTRGVLRLNDHFLKVYPDQRSYARSLHALERSASLPFPTARPTASIPDLLMVGQSRVAGERPPDAAEVAGEAGALLASLHATHVDDLAAELPADELKGAGRHARLVATLVPGLEPRLDALLRRLEASVPSGEDLVTSHGGFHISQLLRSGRELAVVDFDGMCRAPAASDLASYAASLVERPEDLPRAAEALDALVEAYGSRPAGLQWYLVANLLGRTRRPFARVQHGWQEKVEERVAAAEGALEL